MSAYVIITDLAALIAMLVGFHLAFRQRQVRNWWRLLHGQARKANVSDEDPAHYAMIIFGMMLLAFGLIIFCFVTLYSVLTSGAPPA